MACNYNISPAIPRMSSLDSSTSDDLTSHYGSVTSLVTSPPPLMTSQPHYGSVTSLASSQRDQYGSITSLASSTSLISPQVRQGNYLFAKFILHAHWGVFFYLKGMPRVKGRFEFGVDAYQGRLRGWAL